MAYRVAINGYGRIGRNTLRALHEQGGRNIEIVAINDLGDAQTNAYLTKHDTAHGPFPGEVSVSGDDLVINGSKVRVLAERDPSKLPWKEMEIDAVLECTGLFTTKEKASAHLEAGARHVVISAPGGSDVDATIVYGVNHDILTADHKVISNASCTTNCLAPIVAPIQKKIGIERGLMTTIHSYTNDQVLSDVYHKDPRRARSATQNMIPTKTGAAAAIGLVMPELTGCLDGFAVRVPTINVSLVDFTFMPSQATDAETVDRVLRDAAASGPLKGVLEVSDEPLVSQDFNHNQASSIYDPSMTRVTHDQLIKVCAWYDNEWGFSSRMLDVTQAWLDNASK
ncbi:MAG: type I glyceraldehyde-3-phosphate dehydrogenase [Ectothiorhodospiraceae bacterium]